MRADTMRAALVLALSTIYAAAVHPKGAAFSARGGVGADGYNDAYLRSLAMFEDIGTRAVELLGEDSDLSDEGAAYHAGAISYRLE